MACRAILNCQGICFSFGAFTPVQALGIGTDTDTGIGEHSKLEAQKGT